MKHVPRAPRDGINVSPQHPLAEATTLIVGITAIFGLLAVFIFFFVDLCLVLIPPRAEAWLFDRPQIAEILPADYDSDEAQQLTELTTRLASHWPENTYDFKVGVMEDDQPNALAIPGGFIVVTSGLLSQTKSENELAFVLGHEIGHFKNRDHLRQLGRAAVLGFLSLAVSGRDFGMLSNVFGVTSRGFSRTQESDADLFGLGLVQAEYGHVAHSWSFFQRILEMQGESSLFATFLSTHPPSEDRIMDIRQWANERGWPLEGPTTPLNHETPSAL